MIETPGIHHIVNRCPAWQSTIVSSASSEPRRRASSRVSALVSATAAAIAQPRPGAQGRHHESPIAALIIAATCSGSADPTTHSSWLAPSRSTRTPRGVSR